MHISRTILPVIIVFLTSCTPVKIKMNVDKRLADNALFYELTYPNSLVDKISGNNLNVSFGPYRVTGANLGWTKSKYEAENPAALFDFNNTKKSGNTTETTNISFGPTSVLGFTRQPDKGDPTIKEDSKSITYKFEVGNKTTWNAFCHHRAKQRIIEYEKGPSFETISTNFTCRYQKAESNTGDNSNNKLWTLSIENNGAITMTQEGEPNTLTAHPNGGIYVLPEGKPSRLTTRTAGYTWSQNNAGNGKNIAAISIIEQTACVWLNKGNSETINHIISMANTGLLIYSWGIQH